MGDTQSVPSRSDYLKLDIQEKLAFWIALPRGSMLPSDWPIMGEWDVHVRELCVEALKEIQFLRKVSGAVSQGPSFAELSGQSR